MDHVHDFPSLAPSVCFLCEGAETGAKFLDLFREFDAGVATYLNGRKYVCSNCVRDAAAAFGMFDAAEKKYRDALAVHVAEHKELEDKLVAFAHIEKMLSKLSSPKSKGAQVSGG